jgi:hypothetical protein
VWEIDFNNHLKHPFNHVMILDDYYNWKERVCYVEISGNRQPYFPKIINKDDYILIIRKYEEVHSLIKKIKDDEEIRRVIAKHNPEFKSKFDDDIRELAKRILQNSESGFNLFLDKCNERTRKMKELADSINSNK